MILEPFLHSYDLNYIKKKMRNVSMTMKNSMDRKVIASVKESVQENLIERFNSLSSVHQDLFYEIEHLSVETNIEEWLSKMDAYRVGFPPITAETIRNLFPKEKKLLLPDLNHLDLTMLSYLGWSDPSKRRLYIVYPYSKELVGIPCNYTPCKTTLKYVCSLCSRIANGDEIALVTAVRRSTRDSYTSFGNYMCIESNVCNANITNIGSLERFVENICY